MFVNKLKTVFFRAPELRGGAGEAKRLGAEVAKAEIIKGELYERLMK